MKNYLYAVCLVFLSTSCITWGLDELPTAEGADITQINFEYRFSSTNVNGFEQLEYKTLNTETQFNGTDINCTITIPEPSGVFTAEIASQINLTNIVGYCDISDAAHIESINGAPVLGIVADWSQPNSYKVTAANGNSKTWTITVTITP